MMKVKRKTTLILIFVLYSGLFLVGSVYSAFQDIGVGARPMGMGRVFVAIADDANATFWNPAGLTQIEKKELTAMYSLLYPGLTEDNLGYNFISYIQPTSHIGTFGLSYTGLSANLYKETIINFSYANQIKEDISVGINVKSMSKKYGTNAYTAIDPVFSDKNSASGISIDLGLLYKYNNKLSFGLCGENLNQPDISLKETDKVPYNVKIGTAYKLRGNTLIGVDIAKYNNVNKDLRIHTGIENWFFNNTLGARVGFGSGNNKYGSVSLGGSYQVIKNSLQLQIDYAYEYLLNGSMEASEGNHRIATTLRF